MSDTPQSPLHRSSTSELLGTAIRSRIFAGELRPGVRMHQADFAREYGVSRIPLREALIALDREGWVTTTPPRGTFVASLDEEGIRDQYAIRGFIYALAERRAAARASDSGLGELLRAHTDLEAAHQQRRIVRANRAELSTSRTRLNVGAIANEKYGAPSQQAADDHSRPSHEDQDAQRRACLSPPTTAARK